ncbi:hypothetical protein HMI54_013742 [Coelomomyces lativittatus]|nr:hypothetical protein HMI55_004650 [Coelomomyces lativittatus]KAJ1514672.1 hypothetical protein HMI54_013742 [Coelomomyces lativittatus]
MDAFLFLFLLLLFFTSIPVLNSDSVSIFPRTLGIQNKETIVFNYANNEFEFGPFKVSSVKDSYHYASYNLMVFLSYFGTVFAETLANTTREILTRFQGAKGNSFCLNAF